MPWTKGQSGNPKGRPRRGQTMTDEIKALLDKTVWPFNKTARELLALRLLTLGIQGEVKAIQYLCDRTDGKPAQALELSSDEKRPLIIKYVDGNAGGNCSPK